MNVWKRGLLFTLCFVGLLFLIVGMSGMIDESARAFVPANVQGENVELVGHVGGLAQAVFVEGEYAYVGFGPQFAVLAISDSSQPVRVGYMLLPSMIEDIDVFGSYAYVVTSAADLRMIDISNPFAPVEVGVYQGTSKIYEVVVADSRAYLAEEEGMRVLDISNAAAPSEVGFYDSGSTALSVAVNGDYAYVAQKEPFFVAPSFLHVVNIAHVPPTQVGVYEIGNLVVDLAADVVGSYAYIGAIRAGGAYDYGSVHIVDLSNPAVPARVGYYGTGIAIDSQIAMTVVEQVAYLLTGEMRMLDVSNPAEPTRVGYLNMAGSDEDIAVADNYAYIADGPRGLRVVDLSNPAKLIEIGAYEALGTASDVMVRDGYVYVADRGIGPSSTAWKAGGLNVVEVTPPTTARVVGFYEASGARGLAIADDHAYLGRGNCFYRAVACDGSLTVVDISSPVAPSGVDSAYIWGGYTAETDELPGQVAVNGSYIYVTAPDGLHILDLATSTKIGLYDFEGIKDIALAEGYLWAAGNGGLRILDLSNPITPTEVSRYQTAGQTEALTIANHQAYLADGKEGLRILDVSDPFNPSQIASFQSHGFARDVAVAHDYAFLASGEAGLRVLDISNPALPAEVGFYDTPGNALAVAVGERYVYVADGQGGLEILQFQHAISGQVMQANEMPFAGVTIYASQGMSLTTDATGAYSFGHLSASSHTFTPSLDRYAFSPPVRSVTVPPDRSEQHFVILPAPLSITLQPNVATTLTISDTQGLPTRLEFPASSVTLTTTLLITPTLAADQPGFHFAGHAFELMAIQEGHHMPDFTFSAPVTATLRYSDDDVGWASNENELALWWLRDNSWQDATQNCNPPTLYQRDPLNNQISLPICRTSQLALFAPTNRLYLPLLFR